MRREANVASALVEIGVYRGRVQQRTYEFCMQVAPKYVASSAMFVYSYIQVSHHHHRSPVQDDRERMGRSRDEKMD